MNTTKIPTELLKRFNLKPNASIPQIHTAYVEKTTQKKFQRVILHHDELESDFKDYHKSYLRIIRLLTSDKTPDDLTKYPPDYTFTFFFNQGVHALIEDNYIRASEAFNKAYRLNKDKSLLVIYMGILLTIRKNYYAAEKYLTDVIKKEPNNEDAWYYLGENYFRAGSYKKALETYETVKNLNPAIKEIANKIKLIKEKKTKKVFAEKKESLLMRTIKYFKGTSKD